jgi:hypothetical protein
MLVDDQALATGTEADAATPGTTDGASEAAELPSVDWDTVTAHPEFKAKAQSVYDANEEIRKEALRGVRKTDIERRAEERASEIAKADRERANALQARIDAAEAEKEQRLLSTMTDDEQERHKLVKELTATRARLADYETRETRRDNEDAVEKIIKYAQTEWGLNEENSEKLRDAGDTIDLLDRAMKAATMQWRAKEAAFKDLEAANAAKGRVLSGESTFAATGATGAGGEASDDEKAERYRNAGPSHPQYAQIRAAYTEVYRRRGY